jgi:hypothetical protein
MTTPLTITRIWPGETVAILGNGPTLAAELESTERPTRSIAVNCAVTVAPWADMLVSIDGNWPADAADYAGMRIMGIESDLDAHFVHMPHEVVRLGPSNEIHIRNNALSAIRIAAQAGAAKIVLFGFDTERYEEIHDFPGVTIGLSALIAELQAQGIEVERYDLPAPPKRKGA